MKNEIRFLGENLYQFRKEKGISQEELANKIGVSRQAVYKWETGERIPDITNLNALCVEFNKSLEDFIEGADSLVKTENIYNNENEVIDKNKDASKENNNFKKLKKILKIILIIVLLIYVLSVIIKFSFFSIMFAKLNKYKGANDYSYHKKSYYDTFNREFQNYIQYKDGIQYVIDMTNDDGIMSETWYYYKSPEEKATYGIDMKYNTSNEDEYKYTYYYQEGFAYKYSSPYELASEIAINNYNIINILNPLYILNIDFKNKDFIIEEYNKKTEFDNQVYIHNIKYIDLETGLLSKKEEYELDKLVSYTVYYNYEFDKINYSFELSEETKKQIIDGYKKQLEEEIQAAENQLQDILPK